MELVEFISQPWHWSVSGLMIAFVMFLLIYFGQKFGVSSSFETLCTIGGGGRFVDYFKVDWKQRDWLIVFVVGAVVGGAIGISLLGSEAPVQISQATVDDLQALGITTPTAVEQGRGFIPHDLMNFENLGSVSGFILMVFGGFLIGFGTRYAGGCTSGHAITGLSNLQLPSLVAVVGFFIGGLITTFILFPLLLN